MTKLPDKIGDLIRLAVKDLTLCESSPKYGINMNIWHARNEEDNICYVCLAGSVMAQSLGVGLKEKKTLNQFPREIDDKLWMLNFCRYMATRQDPLGDVNDHCTCANYDKLIESKELREAAEYRKDPGQFKTDMLHLADLMDKHNVTYTGD